MKPWYCEQCGTGPHPARGYSLNGLTVCHNCFFAEQAADALKRHTSQPKEKILSLVLSQDRPYYTPIGEWLNTCCQINPAHWTASNKLYDSYTTWCATHNQAPCNTAAFKRLLGDYGLPVHARQFGKIGEFGTQGLHLTNS